ncbi:MAG: coenzyme F420-0:L-glutamate ligase [Gallionella sp.]|nr:coenzyme F420-0:L-glutamate ligase [Gallionella sp.]
MEGLRLFAPLGIPAIRQGDDLAILITTAIEEHGETLQPGDIIVIAQKIVSKQEGRLLCLSEITPSHKAVSLAAASGKDPRFIEAILMESDNVLRAVSRPPHGTIITRHHHGWICANAGIDQSNLDCDEADNMVLLLPVDPDASARKLQAALEARYGGTLGVIISDTFGRPFRKGLVNVAIGVASVPVLVHMVGEHDAYGRMLRATRPALADELAAASGLLMTKAGRTPVVVVRGLDWRPVQDARARDIVRPDEKELFL